jgi:hypothetical protein
VEGTFTLLERHPEDDADWMRYRMTLRSRTEPSQTFALEGHKVINVGSILAAWKHTTTLYVTIYHGATAQESALRALGIMHVGLTDVHHLLAQAEVLNVNRAARERYLVRFVGHEGLELGDDLAVMTGGEVCVHSVAEGCHPCRVESGGLCRDEGQ